MILVGIIDLATIIGLIALANSGGGVERALPFATFLMTLIPIESLLPLGFFTLTTHRVIVGTLMVLYLIQPSRKPSNKMPLPLKGLIFLHIVWSVISTANSIVPEMSIKKLLSVVLEYYLLYFIFWKSISKVQTIHKLLMAIVLAMIACCVWGTFEAYLGCDIL